MAAIHYFLEANLTEDETRAALTCAAMIETGGKGSRFFIDGSLMTDDVMEVLERYCFNEKRIALEFLDSNSKRTDLQVKLHDLASKKLVVPDDLQEAYVTVLDSFLWACEEKISRTNKAEIIIAINVNIESPYHLYLEEQASRYLERRYGYYIKKRTDKKYALIKR